MGQIRIGGDACQGQKVAPPPLEPPLREMAAQAYLLRKLKPGIFSHYNGIFSGAGQFARWGRIFPVSRLVLKPVGYCGRRIASG